MNEYQKITLRDFENLFSDLSQALSVFLPEGKNKKKSLGCLSSAFYLCRNSIKYDWTDINDEKSVLMESED